MEELRLDGNAAAGLLRDVFAMEVTTAVGTCEGCGSYDAVGDLPGVTMVHSAFALASPFTSRPLASMSTTANFIVSPGLAMISAG